MYAVAGWLFGAITAKDSGFPAAFVTDTAWHASAAAVVGGMLCASPMAWINRWYTGAAIALLSGPLLIYLNFAIWPVQSWEINAYKATTIVIASYWEFLLPITLLGGAFAVWWSNRPPNAILPPAPAPPEAG